MSNLSLYIIHSHWKSISKDLLLSLLSRVEQISEHLKRSFGVGERGVVEINVY